MGSGIAAEPRQGRPRGRPSGTAAPARRTRSSRPVRSEARSAAEVGLRCQSIVFSMLADDAGVCSPCSTGEEGLMRGLPEKSLHVSLSTIALVTAERLAETARGSHGQRYVSAPGFRTTGCCGGRPSYSSSRLERLRISTRPSRCFRRSVKRPSGWATNHRPANLVKLCGNFAILAAIETMGEAMALR